MCCAAWVRAKGCREGHSAPTVQPALLSAIASRAVVNQRHVATINTFGFSFTQSSAAGSADLRAPDSRISLSTRSRAKDFLLDKRNYLHLDDDALAFIVIAKISVE